MKKTFSLLAAMLVVGAAMAQTVSINDLRGSYVFRGEAYDWSGFGLNPPTISTITLAVNEADNTVSMTGFLGANVAIWADDSNEPVYGSLNGTYNPETQILEFEGSDGATFFTLNDDYYDWYIYDLSFKATRDENDNVVLDMVPSTANNSLGVIQTYDWDDETASYVYPSYGYDQGGQAIQLSSKATSVIGELEAGDYQLNYTDYNYEAHSLPATVGANADGTLSLTIGKGNVTLTAQTNGRGANKYTYAYISSGCWSTGNIYYYGTGEYDYDSYMCPEYWGQTNFTLYFNADGSMSFNTPIWFGSEEGGFTAYSPVLASNKEEAIEPIRTDAAARIRFDLQGRRTTDHNGLLIENGKVQMSR